MFLTHFLIIFQIKGSYFHQFHLPRYIQSLPIHINKYSIDFIFILIFILVIMTNAYNIVLYQLTKSNINKFNQFSGNLTKRTYLNFIQIFAIIMEMQSHSNNPNTIIQETNVQELKYILVHKDQIIENYVSKINQQQEEIQSLTKQIQKINSEIKGQKFQSINLPRKIQNVKLLIQSGFVQIQQNHRYILVQIQKDAHQVQLSSNLKIVKKQFIKKDDVQVQNMRLYCQKVLSQVQSLKQMTKIIDLKKEEQIKRQNQLKLKEQNILKISQEYEKKKMSYVIDEAQTDNIEKIYAIDEVQTDNIETNYTIDEVQTDNILKQYTIDEVQTDSIPKQEPKVQTHEQVQTDQQQKNKELFKQFQVKKQLVQEHGFQTQAKDIKQTSTTMDHFYKKQNEKRNNGATHNETQNWSQDQQISQKNLEEVNKQYLKLNTQEHHNKNQLSKSQKKERSSILKSTKKSSQKKSMQKNQNTQNLVSEMLHIKDSKEITKRLVSQKGSGLQIPLTSNVSIMSQASETNPNLNFLEPKQTEMHISFEDKVKTIDINTPSTPNLHNTPIQQKKPDPLNFQSLFKLPEQKKQGQSNKKKTKTIFIRR